MAKKKRKKTQISLLRGLSRLKSKTLDLLTNELFLTLTVVGNSFIVLNAIVFYFLESGNNAKISGFLDALWWAFATVTTVGYGDVVPVTDIGKIHGILLMLSGSAIYLAFIALFSRILIEDDIEDIETEVKKLEKEVEKISG